MRKHQCIWLWSSMLSNQPSSRTRISQRLRTLDTAIKTLQLCCHHYRGRNMFQLQKVKSSTSTTHIWYLSLQQVFLHLSFFLHQPLRLCSKGKNWQLHVNIQEDTAASRVIRWPVPKGARVWRRDQHNSRGRHTAPPPGVGQWAATDHPS